MDSMFHGQVAHQTKGQICSVLNSDKKELKTVALLVQHQSNNIDYGVFPQEFVHYILSEKKTPVEVNFDTSKMRTHLLHCLVENNCPNFYVAMEIIENVFSTYFTKTPTSPFFTCGISDPVTPVTILYNNSSPFETVNYCRKEYRLNCSRVSGPASVYKYWVHLSL